MAALYRTLADILREAGCRFERQGNGSHEIWYSPITRRTFTVPSNIDGRPLANAILKQAGCRRRFDECGSHPHPAPPDLRPGSATLEGKIISLARIAGEGGTCRADNPRPV
jgi:hypothetical protein